MPLQMELTATAYTTEQIPIVIEPQIAMAGRSNVGKSSFLNALAGRRNLAKTSAKPGKTRSVNFYRIPEHGFYLVDLPGYGYAKASLGERRKWSKLLEDYFESSRPVAVALLIDCRLVPQENDQALVAFARARNLPLIPILTKADKCTNSQRAVSRGAWESITGMQPLVTSSEKLIGIEDACGALVAAAGRK